MSENHNIDFDEFNCINSSNKETFKEMSFDKTNKVHLVQSENLAFNFDKIHHKFASKKSVSTTSTCDSIYYDDNEFYFIEFRNVPSKKRTIPHEIIKKMIHSYLNFNDLLIEENYLKYNFESYKIEKNFIFVYSQEKTLEQNKKGMEQMKYKDSEKETENNQHRNRYKGKELEDIMREYVRPYKSKLYKNILFVDNISFEKNYAPGFNKFII